MTRVFCEVLNRHPDKVSSALRDFTCLTEIDYSIDTEALRSASAAFVNRRSFCVGNQTVFIATSYGLKQKRSYIARLFQLCNEEERQFQILGKVKEPNAHQNTAVRKKTASDGVTYFLFGIPYHSTQAEMLYRTFDAFLNRAPELIDWAAEHLNCITLIDYTREENRHGDMPSPFKSCQLIKVGERYVCVGSAYGLKYKQIYIDKFRRKAGLPENSFRMSSGTPNVMPTQRQRKAIRTVLCAIKERKEDNRIGLLLQPVDTGVTQLLGGLIRTLLHDTSWTVLLLTQTAVLAEQYCNNLRQQLYEECPVELAKSSKHLRILVEQPRTIVVSTAQKLLSNHLIFEKEPPFSDNASLLVIADDASSGFFGRIGTVMHRRFPNAAFLGQSAVFSPSERVVNLFGPVLYQYTYREAYEDGLIREVCYQAVHFDADLSDTVSAARIAAVSDWIVKHEREKDCRSLLLCRDHKTLNEYYRRLLPEFGVKGLKIRTANNMSDSRDFWEFSARGLRWDGKPFAGIVLACTPMLAGAPFDEIYLDRPVAGFDLSTVLSVLMRTDYKRRKSGMLYDFVSDGKILHELISADFPLSVEEYSEPLSPLIEKMLSQLTENISLRQYASALTVMEKIAASSSTTYERLEKQLAFLFPPEIEQSQLANFWDKNREQLAWKSDLWRLFSHDSTFEWIPISEKEPVAAENVESEAVPAAVPDGESPQARGTRLERAVKELIRRLFSLSSEDCLQELHIQNSGTQFGFDVGFRYSDRFGAEVNCKIECKDYLENLIPTGGVLQKLFQIKLAGEDVDHWILISPNGRIGNDLREMLSKWKDSDTFLPIRDIQIWTRDEMVEELFGLFPELFDLYYKTDVWDPRKWDEEKRGTILSRWRAKIAPSLHLPDGWKKYLSEPRYLLTPQEAGSNLAQDYDEIYQNRVPMRLLNEHEWPMDGTAEDQVMYWLDHSECPCALLLGDFGDGKSFFTYIIARQLAERFLASPTVGWIPLRLSLRELGDYPIAERDYLDQRLREFCDGIRSWNEMSHQYRFLLMLDGLDEMSLGMNDAALLRNLNQLEKLVEQFHGHKILLTSRKMVLDSQRVYRRVLNLLQQPVVWHLAQLRQGDRMAFLERFASTAKRRARLQEIKRTHDLIGLAAKPLFLDMMRVQLDSDEIRSTDMSMIYQDYAEKILERKFIYQLAQQDAEMTQDELIPRILDLLDTLAICLQRRNANSISLDDFLAETNQNHLAQLLWNIDGNAQVGADEDAGARLSHRSLLKCDHNQPQSRCFCHRSMKEYFVARGMCRRLCNPDENVSRNLLAECSFSYEIMEFAGWELRRETMTQQHRITERLLAFARETKGKDNHPRREDYARLGTNSVNLLHFGNCGLPGKDWSGRLLDNTILSEEDLSGKDFSGSSLRFAHLDNASLIDCNLRSCDFTGVQLEKSGRLSSFSLLPDEGALLAFYADGRLRRWQIANTEAQTLHKFDGDKNARLLVNGNGREGLLLPEHLRFWLRGSDAVTPAGSVVLRQNTQMLDAGTESVLARNGQWIYLLTAGDGTICWQKEVSGAIEARLICSHSLVLWAETSGLELIYAPSGKSTAYTKLCSGFVSALCAAALSEGEAVIFFEYAPGKIKRICASLDLEQERWNFDAEEKTLDCRERIKAIDTDGAEEIYVGTEDGCIIRYSLGSSNVFEPVGNYRLELKCAGAVIDGLHPREQYEILRNAIKEL